MKNCRDSECVSWTFDPELQFALWEHKEHFPWLMVAGGTALVLGAGAAAYYFFFYSPPSSSA